MGLFTHSRPLANLAGFSVYYWYVKSNEKIHSWSPRSKIGEKLILILLQKVEATFTFFNVKINAHRGVNTCNNQSQLAKQHS